MKFEYGWRAGSSQPDQHNVLGLTINAGQAWFVNNQNAISIKIV